MDSIGSAVAGTHIGGQDQDFSSALSLDNLYFSGHAGLVLG
jgi:hypothetical protein